VAKKLQIWCDGSDLMLTKPLLDTTRGRIVTRLQRSELTADELASQLGLTANAVRAHLTAMERDGIVRRTGTRAGTTRPAHLFELTPQIEQLLSRAYVPLLTELIEVFAQALPPRQVKALLRQAGKRLATALSGGRKPSGSLETRVTLVSALLNEHLGALTHVERNGRLVIRGAGCPLSAVTGKYPGVCLAMESAIAEIVGSPTRQCCERDGRPRCCFEITNGRASRTRR
jgi:predicted ArsR family transcriptional regulator